MKYSSLTFTDLRLNGARQIIGVNKILDSKEASIDDLGRILPCAISINWQGGNLFLDHKSESIFGVSKEVAFQSEYSFFSNHFEESSFASLMKHYEINQFDFVNGKPLGYWNKLKNEKKTDYYSFAIMAKGKTFIDDQYFSYLLNSFEKPKNKYYNYAEFLTQSLQEHNIIVILAFDPSTFAIESEKVDKILAQDLLIYKKVYHFLSLTVREKEVIKYWVSGLTAKQIAEKIFLSPKTVETHRKNIYRKLEINSFYQLLKFASGFQLF